MDLRSKDRQVGALVVFEVVLAGHRFDVDFDLRGHTERYAGDRDVDVDGLAGFGLVRSRARP